MAEQYSSAAVLRRLLGDIEAMLKSPTVAMELGKQGINMSLALTAVQGVTAYIDGNVRRAIDDLSTAAEEMQARLQQR